MSVLSLTKSAYGLLQDRLAGLGFEKRKPGIFSSVIAENVVGWIGLNTATRGRKDALEINPVVGVRNQRVEQLVAELVGDAFDDLIPPTVAGNVGYLSPGHKYLAFTFSDSGSNEDVADGLCDAVKVYGLPFMRRMVDLRSLVEEMQTTRLGMPEQLNYRIPVGIWLLDEADQAKAFVAARLSEIGARADPAALRYRAFATRLNARLDVKQS
jgi:hypothetical protein